jgi:hypothetical protein
VSSVEYIIGLRNACEHPGGYSGNLLIENFTLDPDGKIAEPTWHREKDGQPLDAPSSIRADMEAIIHNLLTLGEDIVASWAADNLKAPALMRIRHIPAEQRDPKCPINGWSQRVRTSKGCSDRRGGNEPWAARTTVPAGGKNVWSKFLRSCKLRVCSPRVEDWYEQRRALSAGAGALSRGRQVAWQGSAEALASRIRTNPTVGRSEQTPSAGGPLEPERTKSQTNPAQRMRNGPEPSQESNEPDRSATPDEPERGRYRTNLSAGDSERTRGGGKAEGTASVAGSERTQEIACAQSFRFSDA